MEIPRNARSRLILFLPFPRAARHDKEGVWVRSSASTLRRAGSKSLKHRTREEGAGKGEFAFTECSNSYRSLAQNCSICAKEEPQAIKEWKANSFAFLRLSPCGDEPCGATLPRIYPLNNAAADGYRRRLLHLHRQNKALRKIVYNALEYRLGNVRAEGGVGEQLLVLAVG